MECVGECACQIVQFIHGLASNSRIAAQGHHWGGPFGTLLPHRRHFLVSQSGLGMAVAKQRQKGPCLSIPVGRCGSAAPTHLRRRQSESAARSS
jgi:hypothetical protein